MGLDMYLHAKKYVRSWGDNKETVTTSFDLPGQVSYVICEAMYWRKANAIHGWFVRNVQNGVDDCGEYEVSREQLKELGKLCQKITDGVVSPDTLQTVSGFFFGSTEYDEYYMEEVKNTAANIEELLQLPDVWDFSYHSSW